jgi:hypothetical protein
MYVWGMYAYLWEGTVSTAIVFPVALTLTSFENQRFSAATLELLLS